MMKKIGVVAATLSILAVVGVVVAHQRGVVLPGLQERPLAEVIGTPIATGDSIALADFAERRCRLVPGPGRQACFEKVMLEVTRRNHVRLAMDALSVLSRRRADIKTRGHDYTHVVGINAWTPGEDVGEVYESCTGLFQSGCYHGVVQAYLGANGADSTNVATLCDQIPAAQSNMWLRFQCVHGLGHGLVAATQQHLPRALAGCDWLYSTWDAESCYGGAFMEFIVAGRGQSHHPAGGGHADATTTASDEHGDHAEHQMASPPDTFAIRNPTDPLYPCSVLKPRYQRSCYGMQAGIIIEQVGSDFAKIAAACNEATSQMIPACYQGIGTYVSGFTVRDPDQSIKLCMLGHPDHRSWCFVGVVKNFIDVTAAADDGLDFCRRLTDRVLAVSCYVAVGEEMSVLRRGLDQREQECARADPAFIDACRYGAALAAPRPPELPQFSPRIPSSSEAAPGLG